jgi:5'-3' exonuclease
LSKGIILIDFMNLLHAANAGKPLHVGDQPTQAVYGFLRSLRLAACTFPQLTPICLHDGFSWRHNVFAEYKMTRTAEALTPSARKLAELRMQIPSQKALARSAISRLGVRQIHAMNLEADDLAGIMVRKAAKDDRKVVLLSGDKDWIQLVGPNVTWFDPMRDVRLTAGTLPKRLGLDKDKGRFTASPKDRDDDKFIGVSSPRAWLELKALMGDKSDDIDGIRGVGPVRAMEFIQQFGSFVGFSNQSLDGSLPSQSRFATWGETEYLTYQRNMMLMDLNSDKIPAPESLTVDQGCFDESSFEEFCRELHFQSILTDLNGWMQPFRRA